MSKRKLKPKNLRKLAIRDLKRDVLFHVPSALIILFYSKTWLYSVAVGIISKSASLFQFLNDWQWFFHIPLIIAAIILPLWNKYITASQIAVTGSEEIRVRIAEILNKAVNVKETRFREMLKEKRANNSISHGRIFKTITLPIQQIQVLSENLLALFRHVCESDYIKLTVIICQNNSLQNFVYHSDHEPKTTIEELNSNDSLAKRTLNDRRSKLVSVVDASTVNYFHGLSNIKSIYCYPISKSAEVNFILSFTCLLYTSPSPRD